MQIYVNVSALLNKEIMIDDYEIKYLMIDQPFFPFSDFIGLRIIEYDEVNNNISFASATNPADIYIEAP